MPDPLSAFSRNVRAARASAGLTQDQVADAANLDVGQYRAIESGRTNASIRTVARVAAGLGLTELAPLFDGVLATAELPKRKGAQM